MEIEYKRSKRLSHKEKNINQTVEKLSLPISCAFFFCSFSTNLTLKTHTNTITKLKTTKFEKEIN